MPPEEPTAIPGNPTGFIRDLQAEGEGPTAGLRLFRDAGGSIQDARWFDLYRQTADTLANTPATVGLDPYSVPGPGEYSTWAWGRGDQYMTQVNLSIYDRDLDTYLTQPYTYVTDEPHTPAEAEDAAIDQFDPLNTGSDFNQVVYGAVATDVARTVAYVR